MAGFFSKLFGGEPKPSAPFCSAVVAAAGSSLRMGGENKLLMFLDGIPVLIRSLLALDQSPEINEIVVVTRGEDIVEVGSLCKEYGISKPVRIVAGSDIRSKSVLCGVLEVSPKAGLIAVHDGARPLVTPEIIGAAVRKAAECGAAAPAVPVKDTVKTAVDRRVTATPDRSFLFAVQTPQVFEAGLLKAALQSAVTAGADLTDDCSAVERLGMSVMLTEGSEENMKITTPLDLALAEAILAWREEKK
ncbi:2-C-methyl-D-erythritol 4-phosphate cytidylyltransferase [Papillibacter cinnamivorans]|uniref:2-C-methyl-D-erythritol 4-phosphate cytidylyltransferase n=1 Tax=Papillibacter cinnamivorans DSM 12816 TaxID=1122930 RepID=A0A1W1YV12_9FIRM|nr:2-C-methyl-D-erythritol 4-phosphate cytidylyltransferase [Papillibacter cinnamivorans]SMC39966.1 2-C-methyl-D-erythritol 4-phosphate cytidylyltransferase [Papillibacter cinnamivorans DSM 12816]